MIEKKLLELSGLGINFNITRVDLHELKLYKLKIRGVDVNGRTYLSSNEAWLELINYYPRFFHLFPDYIDWEILDIINDFFPRRAYKPEFKYQRWIKAMKDAELPF